MQEQKRILNSVAYAILTASACIGTVGQPHTWQGWVGYIVAALFVGYAKYSAGENLVMPNRVVWSDEVRKIETGK